MERTVRRSVQFLGANAFLALFLSAATAAEMDMSAVGVEGTPLLKANQTNVGGPLKYPETKPEISSVIVTIQPGGHTNLHQHPVVTYVYMMEGQGDLHIGDKVLHYKAGDAWIEPIDTLNQLFNPGTVPMKNLVVFVGSEGNPNSVAAK